MDYKIEERERTNFLDKRGRAVDGYRVWYTMVDGTIDYVEIPKSQYQVENVKEAIEANIAAHVKVLSG